MRSSFFNRIFVVILVALALTVANAGSEERQQAAANAPAISGSSPRAPKFACLPKDIQLDDVVSFGRRNRPGITVERQLIEMKARCRRGKLVDAKRREIRFFRPSCWGNPPADYLEIQKRETAQLAKLKRRYRVIVFGCNRMIM